MKDEILIECCLKSGVGKKSGKPYVALLVTFPDGYQKIIFPDGAAEKYIFEKNLMEGDSL